MTDSSGATPTLELGDENESYLPGDDSKVRAVRDLSPEEEKSEREHAEDFAKEQAKKTSSNTPFYDPSYTVAIHLRRLTLLETLLTEHLEYVKMERELVEAEIRSTDSKH